MADVAGFLAGRLELRQEEEAVDCILETIERLGSLGREIKGVHLNKSFCGEYLKLDRRSRKEKLLGIEGIWNRYMEACAHIGQIDQHLPFEHPCIQKVIEEIKPEFVVYEFLTRSLEELEKLITVQNKALDRR
ncbi:MAG: hypothetical protein QM368_08555 [Bacillota bacterium]|nr:hypothetical protein [Bacillota bacterium]HHU29903.1 hypothetical protein [Bacillota bacterium]